MCFFLCVCVCVCVLATSAGRDLKIYNTPNNNTTYSTTFLKTWRKIHIREAGLKHEARRQRVKCSILGINLMKQKTQNDLRLQCMGWYG